MYFESFVLLLIILYIIYSIKILSYNNIIIDRAKTRLSGYMYVYTKHIIFDGYLDLYY